MTGKFTNNSNVRFNFPPLPIYKRQFKPQSNQNKKFFKAFKQPNGNKNRYKKNNDSLPQKQLVDKKNYSQLKQRQSRTGNLAYPMKTKDETGLCLEKFIKKYTKFTRY